jgi:hypothetical protein
MIFSTVYGRVSLDLICDNCAFPKLIDFQRPNYECHVFKSEYTFDNMRTGNGNHTKVVLYFISFPD